MNDVETILSAKEPFDFDKSLRFMRMFPPGKGDQYIDSSILHKAFNINGHAVYVKIEACCQNSLRVRIKASKLDDVIISEIGRSVRAWLSLDDDLNTFYETARSDPVFYQVTRELYGYHHVRFTSPWENAAWAILSNRCAQVTAREAKKRLKLEFYEDGNDGVLTPFPNTDQIVELGVDKIAHIINSYRKASFLVNTATMWPNLPHDQIMSMDLRTAERTLTQLPGIGPWSAQFVLVRGMGRMDVLPLDKSLCAAASRLYGTRIMPYELEKLSRPYGEMRGYWAHYLRAFG